MELKISHGLILFGGASTPPPPPTSTPVGIITIQRYSFQNQKSAIAIYFVQRRRPSGSQQNVFEY